MSERENPLAGLLEPQEVDPETLAHLEGKPHPLEELESPERVEGRPRYRVHGGRLEALRVEGRGENRTFTYYPLGNFAARIAREVVLDDGVERETLFEVVGYLEDGARLPLARVRATEFATMGWPIREWGARVILPPGQGVKDILRAAIQSISQGGLKRGVIYRHLGWTTMDGVPVYLHAGGGIGPEGAVGGLEVEPGRILELFALPEPPEGMEEVRVWKALLEVWPRLAPPEVVWPLLLYALGAPLGHAPFALYLAGPTGARKTSLALVAQNLFAPGLDAPPLGWEATANALEGAAFAAKDSVLLVDDYAPSGDEHKRRELAAKAARLIRNQGNQTGRARMRADGTLAPDRPPRGSLLITGEDLPPGHSIRARSFVLELPRGAVDLGALSEAQALAREGVLARALAAWVRYLAEGLEGYRKRLRSQVEELRPHYPFPHGRTTDAAARLHATLELLEGYWATLDLEVGREAVLAALKGAAARQEEYQKDADPVERFPSLLLSALAAGRAHLEDLQGQEEGEPPKDPHLWGWEWQANLSGHPEAASGRWVPRGPAIGWVPENPEVRGLYLNPEATYAVLSRLATENGEGLPSPRTLWKRLGERGVLHTAQEGGETRYLVRVRVGGRLTRVAHLRGSYLAETGNTGNRGHFADNEGRNLVPGNFGVPGRPGTDLQHGDAVPGEPGTANLPGTAQTPSRTAQTPSVPGVPGNPELYPPRTLHGAEGWGEVPDEEVGA
ncbi:hypothetical protein [Thermus caliditerrae]|uniref:hypothetical protein n=1 Tax=Thermus caliditerrae TaxID=1330700 RepID=UPI001F3B21EF|nr:hypothetical protein [Thermus caliditerrae]